MDENCAINGSIRGPSFGSGDLILLNSNYFTANDYCCSKKVSYEKSIRTTTNRFVRRM
ncbi:hypothetical protein RhiirC2_745339 [Rhizophagus irregularis]|uniref:Uncharacterized protein n=1 Tax=Rhizophagus irregularis TaxID=588596 RepID=A0A2N1NAW9_9GLOM|nr:hypothetical protein RhiirC2_745339 [Rhizophagus irregularis]